MPTSPALLDSILRRHTGFYVQLVSQKWPPSPKEKEKWYLYPDNMRVVVQRVKEASVTVGTNVLGSIQKGLLVLVGIEENDNEEDAKWIAKKIYNLRIFDDDAGVMNLSIVEIGGDILVVSQFTLHASTKKGNRPSYIKAAKPEKAIPLYNSFVESLSNLMEKPIPTGKFGAMMEINLVNSGPVTIIIDSKSRE